MATVQEIKDKILLGKAYYLELLEQYTIDDQDGCKSCKPDKLSEIGTSIGELEYRIANDIIDDDVQKLYACFLKLISSYSGMSLPVDPNAIIPGINYDVTIITDGKPDWLDVFWTNMTNDVSGYRDTYFNAEWIGLNPMIQIPGVVQYYVDTDYTNDGQGTIVFKPGKGFFSGGTFRAGNYQDYTPTPVLNPPVIVIQPEDQFVFTGTSLSMTSLATGATSYQWYFNNNPIFGQTTGFLTINNFTSANQGDYFLRATNSDGFTDSEVAVAIEDTGVSITNQSDQTSLGNPNTSGRDITVDYESGIVTIPVNGNSIVPTKPTLIIKQNGVDSLSLFSFLDNETTLIGGNVDNEILTFINPSPWVVYNNNGEDINMWNDINIWNDANTWTD